MYLSQANDEESDVKDAQQVIVLSISPLCVAIISGTIYKCIYRYWC